MTKIVFLDLNPEPDPEPDPMPDPVPDPDPDPLFRGTDPRIRIRTKTSRIRNTVVKTLGMF